MYALAPEGVRDYIKIILDGVSGFENTVDFPTPPPSTLQLSGLAKNDSKGSQILPPVFGT